MRLERVLNNLKEEFRECGKEWSNTKNKQLMNEMHALVGAINEIELFLYDERITTLLNCI